MPKGRFFMKNIFFSWQSDLDTKTHRNFIEKCVKKSIKSLNKENELHIFLEYDRDTLANEYFRDRNKGINPELPHNYFPDDDIEQTPPLKWRSNATLLYTNWLNYFVYQATPYDLHELLVKYPH